jgi:hypothetical protein
MHLKLQKGKSKDIDIPISPFCFVSPYVKDAQQLLNY